MRNYKNYGIFVFIFLIVASFVSADNFVRDLGVSTIDSNTNWIGNTNLTTDYLFLNRNGTYFLSNLDFLVTEVNGAVPNFTVYVCLNTTNNRPSQVGCIKSLIDFNGTLSAGTRYNATFNNITLLNNTAYHIVFQPYQNTTGFYRLGETLGAENPVTATAGLYCTSSPPNNTVQTCGTWVSFSSGIQSITIRLWNGTNTTFNSGINFQGQTPINNSIQYYTNSTLVINTTVIDVSGLINTTHNVYYENGTLFQSITNTSSQNTTNVFTLSIGRYYFNASFTNSTFSNVTDTRLITIYNITPSSITSPTNNSNLGRYLNATWTNATTTNSSVNINNFALYLLNSTFGTIGIISNTSTLAFNGLDMYVTNLGIGSYYVVVEANDTNNNKANSTPILFNHLTNALLNVTATSYNGSAISIFSFTIDGTQYNTTNGLVQVDIIRNTVYNVTIDPQDYAINNSLFTSNNSALQVLNYIVGANNAIFFQLYYEMNGTRFNQSGTTINVVSGMASYTTGINSTGGAIITNITPETYIVTVTASGYSSRQMQVIVENRTSQLLNIYMLNGTPIIFNYKDNGGNIITGVLLQVYTYVNGTLTLVESKIADVTGTAQFYANTNQYYAFNNSKTGYIPYYFDLDPITYTSYNIPLGIFTSGNVTPSVYVTYNPTTYYYGQNRTFTINFNSPYGSLVNYNYTINSPFFNYNANSTNATGAQFNQNFSIPNVQVGGQYVTVTYSYLLEDGSSGIFSTNYSIVTLWQNKTLVNMGEKDYGMLIGDKALWIAIILILVMGTAFLGAGLTVALGIGGIILLLFMNTGFIPSSAQPLFAISGVIIVLMLLMNAWNGK